MKSNNNDEWMIIQLVESIKERNKAGANDPEITRMTEALVVLLMLKFNQTQ